LDNALDRRRNGPGVEFAGLCNACCMKRMPVQNQTHYNNCDDPRQWQRYENLAMKVTP